MEGRSRRKTGPGRGEGLRDGRRVMNRGVDRSRLGGAHLNPASTNAPQPEHRLAGPHRSRDLRRRCRRHASIVRAGARRRADLYQMEDYINQEISSPREKTRCAWRRWLLLLLARPRHTDRGERRKAVSVWDVDEALERHVRGGGLWSEATCGDGDEKPRCCCACTSTTSCGMSPHTADSSGALPRAASRGSVSGAHLLGRD